MKVYVIGSLRNPRVLDVANALRKLEIEVFEDWASPGPECDDHWQDYEKRRGRTFIEALNGHHAQNQYQFDKKHLDEADAAVLVLPAGKSAHMELGYIVGQGKRGYILLDGEPERYDLMYLFATGIFLTVEDLYTAIQVPA
jgi:nucleoside 2-deoxyribosyltransferase